MLFYFKLTNNIFVVKLVVIHINIGELLDSSIKHICLLKDEFKSSQYSQYIKDEEYYNQMHFGGDRSDADTSYYGIYVAIPM